MRRCPICREAVPSETREAPFCSPRCKNIDLGRWLNEEYRIPVESLESPEASAEEPARED